MVAIADWASVHRLDGRHCDASDPARVVSVAAPVWISTVATGRFLSVPRLNLDRQGWLNTARAARHRNMNRPISCRA